MSDCRSLKAPLPLLQSITVFFFRIHCKSVKLKFYFGHDLKLMLKEPEFVEGFEAEVVQIIEAKDRPPPFDDKHKVY